MHARLTAGLALGLALALSAPLAAAQDEPAGAEASQRRLEEAQRKLEEAARELARLSAELDGPMRQVFRMRLPAGDRAVLGVNIDHAPGLDGARVVSVSPGGPAASAGVQAGDLIVGINGRKTAAGRELIELMREVKPGDKVAVDLRRGGKPVAVTIEARAAAAIRPDLDLDLEGLGPHLMHGMAAGGAHPAMPGGMPFLLGPWGDAEFATMTPALGRYFGTDKGLLVVRSPGEAGVELEDGDVILTIGGREPQNGGHALRILRSYQPGEAIDLKILRQKKERTVRIVVPQGPGGPGRHVIIRREGPKAPPPPEPPQRGS